MSWRNDANARGFRPLPRRKTAVLRDIRDAVAGRADVVTACHSGACPRCPKPIAAGDYTVEGEHAGCWIVAREPKRDEADREGQIVELCEMAGRGDEAARFIQTGASVADVTLWARQLANPDALDDARAEALRDAATYPESHDYAYAPHEREFDIPSEY